MKSLLKFSFRIVALIIICASCKSTKVATKPTTPKPPKAPIEKNEDWSIPNENGVYKKWDAKTPINIEEFRAAWIATVANINWPSKPGLSTEVQKEEAVKLLDFLETHNYNAAIFQVRPQADALYRSTLEPWSHYLTGKQGIAPSPYYDPLEFWIEEAHKRGIELHVWLNPYRAHHSKNNEISDVSIVKKNPELVVELENGMWWMDPSLEETKAHSLAVVKDIVRRYDIDGVHFDDYFYPYDSYNNGKDFPDDKSWQQYLKSGGKLSRGDWRRDNVNSFVEMVYKAIKTEKKDIKFGISPFGIWRPGYPASVVGFDAYNQLYADAKLWLNKGWVDYIAPQLYWKIDKEGQRFPDLLKWWEGENTLHRHLWPGLKMDLDGDEQNTIEIVNQLKLTREILPESKGAIHWSIGPLLKYQSLAEGIKQQSYAKKALVPPSPWLDNTPPQRPNINTTLRAGQVNMVWNHPNKKDISKYVLYYKYAEKGWDYIILNESNTSYRLPVTDANKHKIEKVGITAVDRVGNQSLFFEENIK
ncbi:glycoside hydrolase family 10 protein [Joostella sp.]|uniref:glycoside hydrolase family 10 protein n=1 Tax=Joostella sp. TaxID=2231138 RepID=UPI003A935DE3